MKLLFERCSECPSVFNCAGNDFKDCARIEMATAGFGISTRAKDTSYISDIPFGVFMGLKHMVDNFMHIYNEIQKRKEV